MFPKVQTAVFLAATILIFLLAGCGHKPNAKAELEKAADALAKGDAAPPQPQPDPQPQPQNPQPAAAPAEASAAPLPPRQLMSQAMVAYKSGNLEDAVTRLQMLRSTPTLTPEQRMAVQDGVAAVMGEIYALAEKGDSRAIAAVKQYEQIQTAPRR